jgi:hypothetical protein
MVCVGLQILLGDQMEEYELGVAWRKWEDSIVMDHKLIVWGVRGLY